VLSENNQAMASLYRRPDTENFSIACYPRPGAKLVRASLGLADPAEAEKARHKLELLCELEKLTTVKIPANVLAAFSLWNDAPPTGRECSSKNAEKMNRCLINDALRSYLVRASVSNVSHALADKISRLRQFFGSAAIDLLDPRPADRRRHAGKTPAVPAWFKGRHLEELTAEKVLEFFKTKNYGLSSKRHYRELFHGLFEVALKSGIYTPSNPYAANPADHLPSFQGREESITVLNVKQVAAQYEALGGAPVLLFGCQLMIEGGFRLHEILALRHQDLDVQNGFIRLTFPQVGRSSTTTKLKTGERTVTMREPLRDLVQAFLESKDCDPIAWCFTSPRGGRMTSHSFAHQLRTLNRHANLEWTTQDFRHTFATNRIIEGWNLKTLAHEMGTSVQMLERHYAGYIPPPVRAALTSEQRQGSLEDS
jgi:integrase